MLQTLFYPKSIAVIGASSDPKKIGHSIAKNILTYKYPGRVYFVNIKKDTILGKKSYASILDIAKDIDLAIIVIPAPGVNSALEMCGKKGVRNAIVISSGFSETGHEGKKMENEMQTIAENYKIQILGPNCLGILNSQNSLNASFADGMINSGIASFFSQSGALCSALLDWANQRNLGFSQFISIGNKTVIDETDILQYLIDGKNSKVILGYLEGFKSGRKFIEIAKKNTEKPIILLKGAESKVGGMAALSHTGAIAQDDSVVTTACKSANIIRAENIEDFFNLSMFFSWQKDLGGNKIAVISNAGGLAVVATDAIAKSRLALAEFDNYTQKALKEFLPRESSMKNPLDIVGDADPKRYKNAIEVLLHDSHVNGIVILLTAQTVTNVKKTAEYIVMAEKQSPKPVTVCFLGGDKVREGIKILYKNQIPVFDYPHQAVRMFDIAYQYQEGRKKLFANSKSQKYKKICLDITTYNGFREILYNAKKNTGRLDFMQGIQLLEKYEIPFVQSIRISSPNEIEGALRSMEFPIVAKIDSAQILHKTEANGVIQNIPDISSAKKAYERILYGTQKKIPKAHVNGIVFQETVTDSLEIIIGAKRDAQFGPVILFGLGGIYVEIMKEVSMGLAPVSLSRAREMVEEVKFYPLLKGARGQTGYDIDAIADSINKVSQLMMDFEEIQEIDLNPVMVSHGRGGIVAVDCRIII